MGVATKKNTATLEHSARYRLRQQALSLLMLTNWLDLRSGERRQAARRMIDKLREQIGEIVIEDNRGVYLKLGYAWIGVPAGSTRVMAEGHEPSAGGESKIGARCPRRGSHVTLRADEKT